MMQNKQSKQLKLSRGHWMPNCCNNNNEFSQYSNRIEKVHRHLRRNIMGLIKRKHEKGGAGLSHLYLSLSVFCISLFSLLFYLSLSFTLSLFEFVTLLLYLSSASISLFSLSFSHFSDIFPSFESMCTVL